MSTYWQQQIRESIQRRQEDQQEATAEIIACGARSHGWLLGHQRHEADYSGDWGGARYSFNAAAGKHS